MIEKVTPDHVSIETTGFSSAMFGKSEVINYQVRVPKWAAVNLHSSNGTVHVTGLQGPLHVKGTNGKIVGTALGRGAVVTTTNGTADLDFASLGGTDVSCETTNGHIVLSLPADTGARIQARVTNGSIKHDGLTLSAAEDSRKHLDATMGGEGGPKITLSATNGSIVLKPR